MLLISFAVLRAIGLAGVTALNQIDLPLRIALVLMFFLIASAHRRKADRI